MLMTRLDQLKLATRGLVLDEASHDPLKFNGIRKNPEYEDTMPEAIYCQV